MAALIKNIPAGTFAVGDLSFFFGPESWAEIVKLSDSFNKPEIEFKGKRIILAKTNIGRGIFNGFASDSGTIGIIDIDLVEADSTFSFSEKFNREKHTVTFDKPFSFERDDSNGEFFIGDRETGNGITIPTNKGDWDHMISDGWEMELDIAPNGPFHLGKTQSRVQFKMLNCDR